MLNALADAGHRWESLCHLRDTGAWKDTYARAYRYRDTVPFYFVPFYGLFYRVPCTFNSNCLSPSSGAGADDVLKRVVAICLCFSFVPRQRVSLYCVQYSTALHLIVFRGV